MKSLHSARVFIYLCYRSVTLLLECRDARRDHETHAHHENFALANLMGKVVRQF